jgi:uncharacterized membrane protein
VGDGWAALGLGARGVCVAFAVSGTAHLLRPELFRPLMPPALGPPDPWIVASGVAELVSAFGLASGVRWGRPAAAATLLAVWPGNWWYAVRVQRSHARPLMKAAAWARVPLQLPMIFSVLADSGSSRSSAATHQSIQARS